MDLANSQFYADCSAIKGIPNSELRVYQIAQLDSRDGLSIVWTDASPKEAEAISPTTSHITIRSRASSRGNTLGTKERTPK